MQTKKKFTYQVRIEGTGVYGPPRSGYGGGRVFQYESGKAVANILEEMDDPAADFEGVITILRKSNG